MLAKAKARARGDGSAKDAPAAAVEPGGADGEKHIATPDGSVESSPNTAPAAAVELPSTAPGVPVEPGVAAGGDGVAKDVCINCSEPATHGDYCGACVKAEAARIASRNAAQKKALEEASAHYHAEMQKCKGCKFQSGLNGLLQCKAHDHKINLFAAEAMRQKDEAALEEASAHYHAEMQKCKGCKSQASLNGLPQCQAHIHKIKLFAAEALRKKEEVALIEEAAAGADGGATPNTAPAAAVEPAPTAPAAAVKPAPTAPAAAVELKKNIRKSSHPQEGGGPEEAQIRCNDVCRRYVLYGGEAVLGVRRGEEDDLEGVLRPPPAQNR
jgi:hypothetical protein